MNESFIKNLINSNIKMHIIEIGASCPFAYGMMNIPGASKVVHCAESPYGNAIEKYNIKSRMVSKEAVLEISRQVRFDHLNDDVNMIIVTSFQIPSNNDIVPHGWICIATKTDYDWDPKFFHVTLWDNYQYDIVGGKFSRKMSIDYIALIIHRFIEDNYIKNNGMRNMRYVDIHDNVLEQETLTNIIAYVDGKPVRFEDHTREYSTLLLYKGSFNPMHIGHLELVKNAEKRHANSKVVFAISRNTYQKGRIDDANLMTRIKVINDLGYMVLIFDEGYFYDNYVAVASRFAGKTKIVLGVDSFNRLIKCYENGELSELEKNNIEFVTDDTPLEPVNKFQINFGDVEFLVYGRNQDVYTGNFKTNHEYIDFKTDISSTKIRQMIESGNTEEANKLIARS